MNAGPSFGSRSSIARTETTPSASLLMKSRSIRRIVPLSTRSRIAGATLPLNLFPGKSIMTMSTGPNPINPPLIGPSQNPNKVIQRLEMQLTKLNVLFVYLPDLVK